jgi:hypothetical protein
MCQRNPKQKVSGKGIIKNGTNHFADLPRDYQEEQAKWEELAETPQFLITLPGKFDVDLVRKAEGRPVPRLMGFLCNYKGEWSHVAGNMIVWNLEYR